VLSDFLSPPSEASWLHALEHNWDVVAVVIQDPLWEQSFPDASGVVLPLADARTGRISLVRLTRHEAAERRRANEERLARLVDDLRGLDLEPILLSSSEREAILGAFLDWTEQRFHRRGRGW
jgi:hypothetical protein